MTTAVKVVTNAKIVKS